MATVMLILGLRDIGTVRLPQDTQLTILHQGQVYFRVDGLSDLKPFTDVKITLVVPELRVAPVEHGGQVSVR